MIKYAFSALEVQGLLGESHGIQRCFKLQAWPLTHPPTPLLDLCQNFTGIGGRGRSYAMER